VPLLRVPKPNGTEAVLLESNVICEWIEETQLGPRLHPTNALDRAQHRAWMEFGSAILADFWGLETTQDAAVFWAKRDAIIAKFARVEDALVAKPFFAGEHFSLVDAVFGPVFRYFDTFDAIIDLGTFAATPKVGTWRAALAARPSVREAAPIDYPERLRAFLVRHNLTCWRLGRKTERPVTAHESHRIAVRSTHRGSPSSRRRP
jgi:glutathione S-transferase